VHYLTKRIKDLPEEEQAEIVEQLIEEVTSNAPSKSVEQEIELLSEYTEKAVEHYKNFGKMQGFSTGYYKLDDLTKGLVGGEMTVIAGKTSYGKTTLSINIANRVALENIPVLFVTLEMTKTEIASRYMSINNGNSEDYEQVASITAVQANDELNWSSIDGLIANFVSQFGKGLIIIDHLHYFTRELANVAEDLGRITKEIKKNCIRHDVPVILISHVRKTGRGDEAGMDDLRGTSYIAQDADIVMMVGRDKDNQNSLLVKIEKNRNRGFDYGNSERELYLDGIKITDNRPIPIPFK
jgi:replicative DNA helicase